MNLRQFKTIADRRKALEEKLGVNLTNIGSYSLDETVASTRNCENMIGVAQVPLGVAGPLQVESLKFKVSSYYIPLATTEGALVASVNRGCKAISESGGASVNSHRVGITRGPVFKVNSLAENSQLHEWLKKHFSQLKQIAESTSRHLELKKYDTKSVGKYRFIRFYFDTADAMGMNMVTIATTEVAKFIEQKTAAVCISVSGNFCTDKKVSWQNFVNNRGIKTWAEVTLTHEVLANVLKTTAEQMYEVWLAKCMLGSIMAGAIGYNCQAANVIAALFLATGQDIGHVGEGSMAVVTTEVISPKFRPNVGKNWGNDLYISVYLPDLMVGTVGGGTSLATQQEALQLLGVAGGDGGKNALRLAEIVTAAVLAGEISLLASLEEGTLAKAHEKLGRGKT